MAYGAVVPFFHLPIRLCVMSQRAGGDWAKGSRAGGHAKGGRAGGQARSGDGGDGQARSGGGGDGQARSCGGGQATHSPSPPPVAPLESPPLHQTAPWWPGSGGSIGNTYGNQSNPWSGYLNYLQQPHFPPPPPMPPHPFGENSHFVGFTHNLSPPSTTPQTNDKGTRTKTVNINIDDDDSVEANKSVKKRYWTNDEEIRLMSDEHDDDDGGNLQDHQNAASSFEEFIAEEDMIDDLVDEALVVVKGSIEDLAQEASDHRFHPRKYIKRPREEYHQRLVDDYFSDNPLYPPDIFRRRFRMSKPLFLRIVDGLGKWSNYFTTRVDALGRQGLTPLQKCTAAIRQLAHGSEADHLDESPKIAETTAMEVMKYFVEGIRAVFGERYLRRPTMEDVERLLKIGERRGFPGLFGSIDCTHWPWERCPTAWKGQFTRGDQKVHTIILEAVASHDLWIWHVFFGVAGSNNDINVLNQSTLFIEELQRRAPRVQYTVNGNQYNTAYYLADGIYPEWAVFVKSIILPISDKDKLFAQEQEGARKDIECAFGVLKRRWCVLKRPARLYDRGQLANVVLACIILHNMIVEDEKTIEAIDEILDLNEAASTVVVEAPEFSSEDYVPFERVLERDDELKDPSAHMQLKKDLIEHIWNKKGRRLNRSTN